MRKSNRLSSPRKWDAARVFYIMSGGSSFFNSLMFTIMSVYYVSMVHLNPLQLVLVGTTLEGTCLLLELPTGIVADTYSRRLSVIIGTFLLGAAFTMISLVPVFWVVLLGQVISGAGYTFLSGATDAWLADEVGAEKVGPIYVRTGQIGRAAALVGIALSAALGSLSLQLPFTAGGILYMLMAVFLLLVMPETGFHKAPVEERNINPFSSMRDTFTQGLRAVRGRPVLITLMVINLIFGAASEGYDRLRDAYLLKNIAFPALLNLQPVAWFGIFSIAGILVSMAVTERLRGRLESATNNQAVTARLLLWLNLGMTAAVVCLALSSNFSLMIAILIFRSVMISLYEPLYDTWLVQSAEPKVRATVLSMVSQSNALGQMAVGPGIGAVGLRFSLRSAILLSGLMLAPISLLYGRILMRGQAAMEEAPGSAPAD